MLSAYHDLKGNAKKRGKAFTITFEQFKSFCVETEYMVKKGIYKDSFHIDRIREEEGYHAWNIQVLENHKNVKKYIDYCEHKRGLTTVTSITDNSQEKFKDVPF